MAINFGLVQRCNAVVCIKYCKKNKNDNNGLLRYKKNSAFLAALLQEDGEDLNNNDITSNSFLSHSLGNSYPSDKSTLSLSTSTSSSLAPNLRKMPRTKSKMLDRKGRRNSSCIDLKSISSSIDLISLQNEQTLLYRNASLFSSRRLFVDTNCEAGRLVLNRVGSLDLTAEFRPMCASSPFSSACEGLKPSEEVFSSCCSLATNDNRKEFDFDKMDSTLSQSSDEHLSDDGKTPRIKTDKVRTSKRFQQPPGHQFPLPVSPPTENCCEIQYFFFFLAYSKKKFGKYKQKIID
ncbi:hypothetical protein BpHYR1_042647 [Brachionus plicatilis]|uniref:Uncharacterized protein n=1 Tax=Brachionus plicatilis TaxID=10195 RepID=A0A3M7QA88_BRAPC|nr:hypothetical protein BpHYR1_042647 [Brachionus plicatilis]